MSSEVLSVPEEYLGDVIKVIRAGLKAKPKVDKRVTKELKEWCEEEAEYLKRLREE